MDWLEGYFYRKQRSVDGSSAGAKTNYTMGSLIVHKGYGVDSESEIYLNGHCKDDFSDIRFTADDGITELPHWREFYIEGEYAVFRVLFDSIPQSTTVYFYIYYDNPEAGSASDIATAFPLFGDDLEQDTVGNDPSKWVVSQGTLSLVKVSEDLATEKISNSNIAINFAALFFAPDGRLWAGHFTDGTVRVSDDGGVSWTTKYTFAVGSGMVRCVWVASNGYIYASRDGSDILIRSVDGGETWATCLTLSGSSDSVVWQMDEDSTGNLYAGEYSTGAGAEQRAYIYKSVNHGADWTTIWANPDGARHIHFVRVDPYTDKIYASQGDAAKGKLIRSDDGGSSWVTLGSGSSLWHPTSIAFGNGYRLFGQDNIDNLPVCIRKTVDDSAFTTVYTPPATDEYVFWNGGHIRADGLIVFGSWTQTDNERATIIVSWDAGATWTVVEEMATGVGNRGYIFLSNFDGYGYIVFAKSQTSNCEKAYYKKADQSIKGSSADTTQAIAYKSLTFPALFEIEHLAFWGQEDSVLGILFLRQDTTDRISVASWSDRLIKYHNSTDWISSGVYYLKNKIYKIKYIVNLAAGTWDFYIDDVLIASNIPFRIAGTTANRLYVLSGALQQGSAYIDTITVREIINPEPAWGAWGVAEHSPFLYLIGNFDPVYGGKNYLFGDINLFNSPWTRWQYLFGDIGLTHGNKQYLLGDFDLTQGGKAYLQGVITAVDRLVKPAAGSWFMRTGAVAKEI